MFASAYRQLTAAQKAYVDAFVTDAERTADLRKERLSNVLDRDIPQDVIAASGGMLDNVIVCAAIAERVATIMRDTELSVPRILKEAINIAFSSPACILDEDIFGNPTFNVSKANPDELASIRSIEFEENGDGMSRPLKRKQKIVFHDKIAALKMLFDYTGMNNPDNPYWRADNAKPVSPKALPAGTSPQEASDLYSRMINNE